MNLIGENFFNRWYIVAPVLGLNLYFIGVFLRTFLTSISEFIRHWKAFYELLDELCTLNRQQNLEYNDRRGRRVVRRCCG
uniref:Uncharacterized protein n=1 Tax=Tetranychus urticae TaxID=32264 RepID=T1L3D2_TETUR